MSEISHPIETSGKELPAPHYKKPIPHSSLFRQKKSVDEIFAPWRGQVIYHVDIDEPTQVEWTDL